MSRPHPVTLVAAALGAIALFGAPIVQCTNPPPAATVQHWEVGAAVRTMELGTDAAAFACMSLPSASPELARCLDALAAARASSKTATLALRTWEVDDGALKCAAIDFGLAVLDVVQVFRAAGLDVPTAVSDGLAAARLLTLLEGTSCALPPAPVPTLDAGPERSPFVPDDAPADAAHE